MVLEGRFAVLIVNPCVDKAVSGEYEGGVFSYAQAISRLSEGPTSCFKPGTTPAQKLQRVNEVLERFYEFGTWRGLFDRIVPVSVSSVIALPTAYQRLDGLSDKCSGKIDIKSMQWEFQPGGPGVIHTPTEACLLVAIDLGDVGGFRKYQLTGADATNDARELIGLARKRYRWVSDTSEKVEPDSFQALRQGVLALGMEDEGDDDGCTKLFNSALTVLNGNLEEFEGNTGWGVIQIDPFCGAGSIPNLV